MSYRRSEPVPQPPDSDDPEVWIAHHDLDALRTACESGDAVTAERIGGIMAAYSLAVDDRAERYRIAVRHLVRQRRKAAETAWRAAR